MKKREVLLIVFVSLIPFLLVLFSYKFFFNFSDYNPEQQEVIDFLEDGELTGDMTAAERSHMEDVKSLVLKIDYIFYSLLLICTLIFTYCCKEEGYMKKLLLYGGIVTFSSVVLLLFFILVSFDSVFNLFHQIFFPQGNWIFSSDSYLIQTFPITFFISMAKKVIFLSLILASIFIGGGIHLEYVKKV